MVLIGDMLKRAESSIACSQLRTVADGLSRIIGNQPLESRESKGLASFADLFGEIDWHSEHYKRKEHPELCIKSTTLRPLFYETILDLKCPLDADYSERVYRMLKSSGKENTLSHPEMLKIRDVFNSMSDKILSSLQPHPD